MSMDTLQARKVQTIYIPEIFVNLLELYVRIGVFPNKSEGLRIILKDFLIRELQLLEDFDLNSFGDLIKEVYSNGKK